MHLDPPVVRTARPEEAVAVLGLWRAADAYPTATDRVGAIRRLIQDFPGSELLAEVHGELVGTVIAASDGWRGTLYRLAVVPEMRRRGIARALVVRALDRFRSLGIERVSAIVIEDDCSARAFWNSLGDLGIVLDPAPKVRYVATLQVVHAPMET